MTTTTPPSIDTEPLDPLRFPLQGSRLIEASAGTGKTFTIATLYVRLVLGHDLTGRRALTPPEILVVTFTDAATQELRDRIRSRLDEAARYFREDPAEVAARPAGPIGEDLLDDLRATYPPEYWPACARKLQLAAEWMDEAAVSTIHSWCNRMLREHAFDSGSLFTQTLETDQGELLAEVVRDYWRTFMVPLDAAAVAEVRQWWPDPAALQGNLRGLVDHTDRLEAAPEPDLSIRSAREVRRQRLAELKAPWAGWVEELQQLLDGAVASKSVNGRKLRAGYYDPWLQSLRDWAIHPTAEALELNTGWTRLTPQGLADAWTRGDPPAHPALDALVNLRDALASLPEARPAILRHAAPWVARRFDLEQDRRAQMGFNDLLTRLATALDGPNGPRLAEVIRRQFPVALIDEFQDTDPVQYRIFDAVYRIADNDQGTALILIGDPKQAIYAFRGADIFTYLQARRACAGRLYTLKRNYRSTQAMVRAANRCFLVAEDRPSGNGAFLFRGDSENPVPFTAAVAQGRPDTLHIGGQSSPALTVWWLPAQADGKPIQKGVYRDRMADACASEIVRLLNLSHGGQAGFAPVDAPERLKALCPADLAVLVNKRQEADLVRRALARRGVRSVYLSDQDSVFMSPQAGELQHWLAACAEPDDPRVLRTALATSTLGLGWSELERFNQDELAWEARVLQFRGYRDLWRRQGVLPMLRRLLNDFRVPARLLSEGAETGRGPDEARFDGERLLTDLLHLAELLQQASALLDGEHALIRHLAEECREAGTGGRPGSAAGDARQIRLESDADLVQVVTVHKSKGLEYPLVFLPFAADYRSVKSDDLPLKWHDDPGDGQQGQSRLSLTADSGVLERADRERLGEDLRKFYVALTRARYATWVGLAPLERLEQGAFGYLLGGGEPLAGNDLAPALEALRADCPDIALVPAPQPGTEHFRSRGVGKVLGSALVSRQVVREPWWIASYSALRTVAGETAPRPERILIGLTDTTPATPAEDRFQEMQTAGAAEPESDRPGLPMTELTPDRALRPAPGTPHAFPRGSEAGSFLHDLLEWAATQGFGRVSADPDWLRDTVARRCQVRGWDQWIDPLADWLYRLITQPFRLPAMGGLAPTSFSLAGLATAVPEMEFWLAAHRVDAQVIDRLVSAQTLGGAPRPVLQPTTLNGMLKGFMDLVFEHEGRYYVADYKSNWLGPDAAAYTTAAMGAEVLHARYELQYVLYLFALHRLLKARLPDYDYDRHVGGAVYLFLRGLEAPSQGLHAERPPRGLIEALDSCFARSVEEVAR